jgi:hypothetical protein
MTEQGHSDLELRSHRNGSGERKLYLYVYTTRGWDFVHKTLGHDERPMNGGIAILNKLAQVLVSVARENDIVVTGEEEVLHGR